MNNTEKSTMNKMLNDVPNGKSALNYIKEEEKQIEKFTGQTM